MRFEDEVVTLIRLFIDLQTVTVGCFQPAVFGHESWISDLETSKVRILGYSKSLSTQLEPDKFLIVICRAE